jgi:DNA-entry nuclease
MKRRKRKNKKKNIWQEIISIIVVILILGFGYINQNNENSEGTNQTNQDTTENTSLTESATFDLTTIPEYSSSPYVEINNNIPYFTDEDYTTEAFENYSQWDGLGRSGVAFANVCKEIMPADGEERGTISSVNDLSGWVQKKYENVISDQYLYNRCHLIGWQLAGENANKQNLITGTRYLNTDGMLPFENQVANYIKNNTNNHVLYRVTPIFEGNNKLASGVEMEAWSVEDNGKGICFNVYCYNVQPGIEIDYATGESKLAE